MRNCRPTAAEFIQTTRRAVTNASPDHNIARDLDAAFLKSRLRVVYEQVVYEVAGGVVTLTGDVSSLSKRARAE